MAQIGSFRIGWENENLASYILSRFSFIASPHSVGDDAGTDFFCTLFRRKMTIKKKTEFLLPDNSFAIQIKSNKQRIPATKKTKYLSNLEIPFFIGVIDRKRLCLTLYSGEWIPAFFAYKGSSIKLKLKVSDDYVDLNNYHEKLADSTYLLKFPKVFDIGVQETPEALNKKVEQLSKICSFIHENIASKKNQENLYKLFGPVPGFVVVAGRGSLPVFRDNFFKRFTEVFLNLHWGHENAVGRKLKNIIRDEFNMYDAFFSQVQTLYGTHLPSYLIKQYESARDYFANI